jgi:hypothetical protein
MANAAREGQQRGGDGGMTIRKSRLVQKTEKKTGEVFQTTCGPHKKSSNLVPPNRAAITRHGLKMSQNRPLASRSAVTDIGYCSPALD